MEDFARHFDISKILSLIYCMFWISSRAEGHSISAVVGSRVVLHCNNRTEGKFQQLTWKMNGTTLITFTPQNPIYFSEEAYSLKINLSLTENHLYRLVVESVQKSHAGSYTCETTMDTGVWDQKWELVITEPKAAGNWTMQTVVVTAAVSSVCCLIFISALIILLRICNGRATNSSWSPTAEVEPTEDIYENCLEIDIHQQRRYHHQLQHCKNTTQRCSVQPTH